jgi:hypothetical protein
MKRHFEKLEFLAESYGGSIPVAVAKKVVPDFDWGSVSQRGQVKTEDIRHASSVYAPKLPRTLKEMLKATQKYV